MTIGEKIKLLRQRLGMDQTALGDATGATQPTVSRWETDKQVPGTPQLIALAKLAGETIEQFTSDIDDLPPVTANDITIPPAAISRGQPAPTDIDKFPFEAAKSRGAPPDVVELLYSILIATQQGQEGISLSLILAERLKKLLATKITGH